MKLSGLLCACLLAIPGAVCADNFNYDYLELGYQQLRPRDGDSGKGPELLAAWTLPQLGVQLLAGYTRFNLPATPTDITDKNTQFGIRGATDFGDDTSFYTDILYLNHESNPLGFVIADSGYRLRLGLRQRLGTRFELDASAAHNYLGESSNQARVGLLFNITDWLAVGASLTRDNLKNTTTGLAVRWYY
ncbi:MAG TPA: hypothetical protein VFM15_10800 [Gammaproteobacteria bacterium]|nr:hypothetical protein [Gammaproteobacteria bacterium]